MRDLAFGQGAAASTNWLATLRKYFFAIAIGSLVWEFAHLPLYTLWQTGTSEEIVFAALHCTGGDILIAASTLLAALIFLGPRQWPGSGSNRVIITTVLLGLGYTAFSEWLNVEVRGSWAYAAEMPVLPVVGTGISPLLQWFIVPSVAFWWALRPSSRNRVSQE